MIRPAIAYAARAVHLAALLIIVLVLGSTVAAQLASRPVSEWEKVLDAPERLTGLRADAVVDALKLEPEDVVADLGAGTGPFVVPLGKAVSAGTVYAVEIDEEFFPRIRQRADAAGLANVRTVVGGFTDPRLPARDVDVAFMHDVLHHIEDRAAYVRALATYLKPAARIAIIDYDPARSPHRDEPAMLVSLKQAQALLREVGFTSVEEVALFDDKWFAIFRRSGH
ncbi:MAG: methyltransferase domain-containing protein [Luteitalea sp.]|nr:methyltransferase domain-containing protein [Luteitalea sp.]